MGEQHTRDRLPWAVRRISARVHQALSWATPGGEGSCAACSSAIPDQVRERDHREGKQFIPGSRKDQRVCTKHAEPEGHAIQGDGGIFPRLDNQLMSSLLESQEFHPPLYTLTIRK